MATTKNTEAPKTNSPRNFTPEEAAELLEQLMASQDYHIEVVGRVLTVDPEVEIKGTGKTGKPYHFYQTATTVMISQSLHITYSQMRNPDDQYDQDHPKKGHEIRIDVVSCRSNNGDMTYQGNWSPFVKQ